MESRYRWSEAKGELYGKYCSGTALKYLGRFHKFQTPPRPMYLDNDLLMVCPENSINYLPADLSNDAFYKGLAKFGKVAPTGYNECAFQIAVLMMRKHFNDLRGARVATMDEILCDMKLDTSPGPALKSMYRTKGEAVSDARFWYWYKEFSRGMHLLGGERSFWGACSKQELRPREKVVEGKTRVFMSGSLFMYIFMSVYNKGFNDRFYETVFKTDSCVGMSKFSGGFHLVYNKLRWQNNCGSLDASGWDTTMFPAMMWAIAQFRFECLTGYDPSEASRVAIAMANIYQQVIESYIITPAGELCLKEQGNPSGSSNTIVDNTIGHYILKAYDWLISVYQFPTLDMWETYYDQFSANVDMNLFGDDDMFSVSEEYKELYNPETIIKASSELGFSLTTESQHLRSAVDLSFLSHFVVKEDNGYLVPYLPLDRLCSAAVYSGSNDLVIRAQRLSNLRYEGYYTPGWLPIIDAMISIFEKKHPDPEVLDVFRTQLSNVEIEHLYLPLESDSGKSMPRILKMSQDNASAPSSRQECRTKQEKKAKAEASKAARTTDDSVAWAQQDARCEKLCEFFCGSDTANLPKSNAGRC